MPNGMHWALQVSKLTWFEKQACKAFVAAPPESTFDETLGCFEKASAGCVMWLQLASH
jgi:hypothetical protein